MRLNIVYGISWSYLFLVLFACSFHYQARFSLAENVNSSVAVAVPVPVVDPEMIAMMMMRMNTSSRRKLRGRFQVCSLCTCCGGGGGGGRSYCMASPCCYAINCNIPNRPFGYCSFTPKACNCFGCHI